MNELIFVCIMVLILILAGPIIKMSVWGSPLWTKEHKDFLLKELQFIPENSPYPYRINGATHILSVKSGYVTNSCYSLLFKYAVNIWHPRSIKPFEHIVFRFSKLSREIDRAYKASSIKY